VIKNGFLYLFYAKIYGFHVYKFGVTAKKTTAQRLACISRKFDKKFINIAEFTVCDIYAKEKAFKDLFLRGKASESHNVFINWDERIYSKSWECLAVDARDDEAMIDIMRGVCHG
jgi:hypothetical protein